MRDFNATTLRRLTAKGVAILGTTIIPDASSDMPFANGDRGYRINDNGCGRIVTFAQVLELAA